MISVFEKSDPDASIGKTLVLEENPHLCVDDFLCALDARGLRIALSPALVNRLAENRAFFEGRLAEGFPLYGVNTGFGNSSSEKIGASETEDLQRNLTRYHGCGIGARLSERTGRAVLLARIVCLCQGKSGIRPELAQALVGLWNARLSPCIPEMGSVGASGDLTPLSYLAALLQGEREAYKDGRIVASADALLEAGLSPLTLAAKEGLALMNGTSVMTAIAVDALAAARKIARLACATTGVLVETLGARVSPFRPQLHECKPHAGAMEAAVRILAMCDSSPSRDLHTLTLSPEKREARLQDSYSLRCAPQVVGALFDGLSFAERVLEVEINSVNDNPVVLHEEGLILNGGHFYGSHVALVCDMLKPAVANVASLLDRQLAILVDGRLSNGLPDNLVDVRRLGASARLHHGLKAVQISMTAVACEAQKDCLPASIFSRPTECLNQDVVSLGTIAARDLARVVDRSEWAVTIMAFALRQAAHVTPDERFPARLNDQARGFLESLARVCEPVHEDRALDTELAALRGLLFPGNGLPEPALRVNR